MYNIFLCLINILSFSAWETLHSLSLFIQLITENSLTMLIFNITLISVLVEDNLTGGRQSRKFLIEL